MRKLLLLALLFCGAAFAGPYYGVTNNTTAGTALMNLSGKFCIAVSSVSSATCITYFNQPITDPSDWNNIIKGNTAIRTGSGAGFNVMEGTDGQSHVGIGAAGPFDDFALLTLGTTRSVSTSTIKNIHEFAQSSTLKVTVSSGGISMLDNSALTFTDGTSMTSTAPFLSTTTAASTYVKKAGDTMTGPLTTTELTVSTINATGGGTVYSNNSWYIGNNESDKFTANVGSINGIFGTNYGKFQVSRSGAPLYGTSLYLGSDSGAGIRPIRISASYGSYGTIGAGNFSISRSSVGGGYGADMSTFTYLPTIVVDGSTGNVGIATTAPNSTLYANGSFGRAYAHKVATYTLTATDSMITVDATAGDFTINLPTAVGIVGREYIIKKTDEVGIVTVDANGSQTIDGALTYTLGASGKPAIHITSDGANWWVH